MSVNVPLVIMADPDIQNGFNTVNNSINALVELLDITIGTSKNIGSRWVHCPELLLRKRWGKERIYIHHNVGCYHGKTLREMREKRVFLFIWIPVDTQRVDINCFS